MTRLLYGRLLISVALGLTMTSCSSLMSRGGAVSHNDSRLRYRGAWVSSDTSRYTIYPGSQLQLKLAGSAELNIEPGSNESVMVSVREDGAEVLRSRLGARLVLDSGSVSTASVFSVSYIWATYRGFRTQDPRSKEAELHISGLTLAEGSRLMKLSAPREGAKMEFIGDSITAGVWTERKGPARRERPDASRTYAFKLAESVDAEYRIRGYPGESTATLADKIPFFRKRRPLSKDWEPDLVFINIGANNLRMSQIVYRTHMRRIIDTALKTYPNSDIALLNFFRMTPDRSAILAPLADTYQNGPVVFFDARRYLVGYTDTGIHPDEESHSKLASALESYVNKWTDEHKR